jgi:long-chain acyl-CoA synthetase
MGGRPARAPDDTAMIIYTSGSTGQPKGVMHCFENITRASEGITADIKSRVGNLPENRIMSYLPLAHVFERAWVECASHDRRQHPGVLRGDAGHLPEADLNRARPTTFISVPRLWLKFQQGVFTKMPPKKLDRLLKHPHPGPHRRPQGAQGPRVWTQALLAGSGSAPIPADLIAWYRRLGLNLIEGYAMTEDFAYSHNSTEAINEPGCVGVPLAGVKVRISDEGEILIKSPGAMTGYFKRPDLTAEAFTDDGYFRTGDRGERRKDGLLKITGRVKELFKTAKGKYVAPAPIENMINAHPMVELTLVSGVGQVAAYAMVVLAEDLRPKVKDPAVKAKVDAELSQLLKEVNKQLADYEKLQMIVVAPEPWTVENGYLTPTMKIRRARIESAVEPQLDAWYGKKGAVHWV